MKKFSVAGFVWLVPMLTLSAIAQEAAPKLPANLTWITNDKDPVFASPEAKRGGTLNQFILSFPLTMRYIGPDANGSFRGVILGNHMSLTDTHPNTLNEIPSLATHWAYGADSKTIYYRLNKDAKWSDGTPVTADDYLFTLEFMRSKEIVDPWYNNYYSEYYDRIVKYDDHTIGVFGKKKQSRKEIHQYYNLSPTPRHYYKLDGDFVRKYNWEIAPNTGPYQISDVRKGKSVTLTRKADWWANNLKYYKNRYNVDRIRYTVIRDQNVAFEHFKKGELDNFDSLTLPDYWHDKAKGDIFDKGYVHKLWFYTDSPQPNYGMWMNTAKAPLDDINVRKGVSHAVNVDKVIQTVLRNDYQRLQTGNAGQGDYTNKKVKAREFDLAKADEYLKKAGWVNRGPDGIRVKDGQRLSLEITYGAPHHTDRLVIIKEEAKKAGVEFVLKLLDSATSFKAMREKQHQIAWMAWSTSLIPQYWEHYHSANANKAQTNNISNTADPKMDALIDAYDNEYDDKKKVRLAHQIQERVHELGAYVPTFLVPYFRVAYWRYWRFPKPPGTKLSDSAFEPFGSTGGLFWFDEELKKETDAARKSGKAFEPVTLIDKTYKP